MQCHSCGADLPEDARFCIECGADVSRQASTGATVALPRVTEQPQLACNACGAANPSFAVFCVRCGRRIGEPYTAPAPPMRRDPDLGQPRDMSYSPPPPPFTAPRSKSPGAESAGFIIFLVGLAALFFTRMPIWPNILVVIGISSFISEIIRGRAYQAFSGVLWLFGLAFLFTVPRLFFPGILVLVALSIMLGFARKALRIP
jgi:ribosomal protein L40E